MLQIALNCVIINYYTIVEESFKIWAAQMLQIASNRVIISPWLKTFWNCSNAPNQLVSEMIISFGISQGL